MDANLSGPLQTRLKISVLAAPHPSTKQKTVMISNSGVVNLLLKHLYQLIKNMVLSLQLLNKLIKTTKTIPGILLLVPEIVLPLEIVLTILQDLANQSLTRMLLKAPTWIHRFMPPLIQ